MLWVRFQGKARARVDLKTIDAYILAACASLNKLHLY